MNNNIERVAVLVDREDLLAKLSKRKSSSLNDNGFIKFSIWEHFNDNVLSCVKRRLGHDRVKHMGTWMFVGKRVDLFREKQQEERVAEQNLMSHMKKIDSLFGFIIKYGISYKAENEIHHKGLDVNLVCQMLLGAFEDEYDICILISDDDEFIPAVEIAQNYYGKQIFHAGFEPDRLRAACFGNIPFEAEEFGKEVFG